MPLCSARLTVYSQKKTGKWSLPAILWLLNHFGVACCRWPCIACASGSCTACQVSATWLPCSLQACLLAEIGGLGWIVPRAAFLELAQDTFNSTLSSRPQNTELMHHVAPDKTSATWHASAHPGFETSLCHAGDRSQLQVMTERVPSLWNLVRQEKLSIKDVEL